MFIALTRTTGSGRTTIPKLDGTKWVTSGCESNYDSFVQQSAMTNKCRRIVLKRFECMLINASR